MPKSPQSQCQSGSPGYREGDNCREPLGRNYAKARERSEFPEFDRRRTREPGGISRICPGATINPTD